MHDRSVSALVRSLYTYRRYQHWHNQQPELMRLRLQPIKSLSSLASLYRTHTTNNTTPPHNPLLVSTSSCYTYTHPPPLRRTADRIETHENVLFSDARISRRFHAQCNAHWYGVHIDGVCAIRYYWLHVRNLKKPSSGRRKSSFFLSSLVFPLQFCSLFFSSFPPIFTKTTHDIVLNRLHQFSCF